MPRRIGSAEGRENTSASARLTLMFSWYAVRAADCRINCVDAHLACRKSRRICPALSLGIRFQTSAISYVFLYPFQTIGSTQPNVANENTLASGSKDGS